MRFKEGAEVYTSTGDKVGDIDRVVMNPVTGEITDLVVRKGFLFPDDRVICTDLIDSATEDRVVLGDVEDIEELPAFEQIHYIRTDRVNKDAAPPRVGYVAPYYWYPNPGMTWWGSMRYPLYPAPPYVARIERNIPVGTVPLKEGAKVITSDEKTVGDIESVFVDPTQERATHIEISRGLFFKERKVVPTSWITNVLENEVHLGVSSGLIKSLPEYEEA
jgi:uncharacterized protein YrrD